MKLIAIFSLVICACSAQTIITGQLHDTSGALATCQLTIKPTNVPGFSPSTISYAVVSGDLSGTTGGYGTSATKISLLAALALYPGGYDALVSCTGVVNSKLYHWRVPAVGNWSIVRLNQGTGQRLGEISTSLGNTPLTLGAQ